MAEEYDPLASVQAAGPPGTISLVYGLPDPATFPADDLRRAADRVLRERPALALQYGPEQGYGPLIDYLRAKIEREEGLALARPQMMLTTGSTPTLGLICTLLAEPGDAVLVEAPTYYESLQLFRDYRLVPLQVAADGDGMLPGALEVRLEELARQGGRARLVYVIPNFQNPSGNTLSPERRHAVLELAELHGLLVVEDDVYRDLAYGSPVPPSLYALDGGRRVLRIGSFSKILAPGVRMGWLIGPPALIRRIVDSGILCMGGGATPLMANILADYCRAGLLEPHIAVLRRVYQERRDVALAALAAHMPAGVEWTRPRGGVFTWLTLPSPLRAADVVAQARERGLMLTGGDLFFAEQPTGQHVRLAFSFVAPDRIEAGIRLLGEVLRS